MSAISGIGEATTTGSSAVSPLRTPQKTLQAEDFLKLLTVQLTNQDPLNPVEDTEFIAQMANFSSLEQMNALRTSFDGFRGDQEAMGAQAYLGRQVILIDGNGTVEGMVEAVEMTGEGVRVTVNGESHPVENVRRVELVTPEE